jgi:ABC-type nickel/cobalt efflux system permease component RcnA
MHLRAPLLRQLRARPRLFVAAVAAALALGTLLPQEVASRAVTRWLIAWNLGSLLYVAMAARMMWRSSEHQIRRRALLQDEGSLVNPRPGGAHGAGDRGHWRAAGSGQGHAGLDARGAHRAGRAHGGLVVGLHPG